MAPPQGGSDNPGASWRPRGIAARIALLSLLVTAVAVTVIAIGVLGVAQATFNRLMLEAGQSAATAHAMFDESVVPEFSGAAQRQRPGDATSRPRRVPGALAKVGIEETHVIGRLDKLDNGDAGAAVL